MVRSFIAIDIPENVKKQIVDLQNQLPYFMGKKTELDNLHLTLKFLGEIDDSVVSDVKKLLENIKLKKFEVTISEIGVFNENFIKIIWLKLEGDGIFNLQNEIDLRLDNLFPREKRFMSHLTVARVKNIKNKKEFLDSLKKIKIPEIKFNVDNFILKKSILKPEGPEYKDLGVYKLN